MKPDVEAPAAVDAAAVVNAGSTSSEEVDEHEHYTHRNPWLRAFVLGANDGLVSPEDTQYTGPDILLTQRRPTPFCSGAPLTCLSFAMLSPAG